MSRMDGGSATSVSSVTISGTSDVNIKQVGGASFSLGQQLAAVSLPVVLTASQLAALTPPSAITNYALEAGGNLATLASMISGGRGLVTLNAETTKVIGTVNQGTSPWVANATLQTQTDTVMIGGVNIKEINGVTPLMGNGVTGTGSLRVTIASDNTAFLVAMNTLPPLVAGTAVIGHVIVDSGTISTVSNLSQIASTTPAFGDATNIQNVNGAFNVVPIGKYNATQPTLTDTRYNQLQVSSRGELLVVPGVSNFAVQATLAAETTKVIGTVNQGTSPWAVSLAAETTKIIGTVNPALITSAIVGQKKITASAVQLGSNVLTNGVIFTALSTNAGNIFIGGSGVTTTVDGTGNGYILEPGSSISFAASNTNLYYVIGTANDVLSFAGS